jgi:DnaJ-class molecular chaperone
MSICLACNGSGKRTCPQCGGGGVSQPKGATPVIEIPDRVNICSKCGGSGEIPCPQCDGTGEVPDDVDEN